MRFSYLAAAAILIAPAATAQATRSSLNIYPELFGVNQAGVPATRSTSFTDRGAGNSTGAEVELLAELPTDMFSHVGGTGVDTCTGTAISLEIQDEDLSTQEVWFGLMRNRDAQTFGPDMSTPNGFFAFTAALPQFPCTPPAPCGGAFLVSVAFPNPPNFPSPITLPCESDYFFGARVPANPNWVPFTDGLSLHMADYTNGQVGENPRVGAPSLGWSVLPGQAPVAQDHAWSLGIGVPTPTLQIGGDDPGSLRYIASTGTLGFGAGGMYPDVSAIGGRTDGLSLRIQDDTAVAGDLALGLFGLRIIRPAVTFPFLIGPFSLDPIFFLDVGNAPFVFDPNTSTSSAVITVVPPAIIPPTIIGTSPAIMAVVVKPTALETTNTARVSF